MPSSIISAGNLANLGVQTTAMPRDRLNAMKDAYPKETT